MSLNKLIINEPLKSPFISRIPFYIIENKTYKKYIDDFVKEKDIMEYYVFKYERLDYVYIVFTTDKEDHSLYDLDSFFETTRFYELIPAPEYVSDNMCCAII